jgi:hypothetical protein
MFGLEILTSEQLLFRFVLCLLRNRNEMLHYRIEIKLESLIDLVVWHLRNH